MLPNWKTLLLNKGRKKKKKEPALISQRFLVLFTSHLFSGSRFEQVLLCFQRHWSTKQQLVTVHLSCVISWWSIGEKEFRYSDSVIDISYWCNSSSILLSILIGRGNKKSTNGAFCINSLLYLRLWAEETERTHASLCNVLQYLQCSLAFDLKQNFNRSRKYKDFLGMTLEIIRTVEMVLTLSTSDWVQKVQTLPSSLKTDEAQTFLLIGWGLLALQSINILLKKCSCVAKWKHFRHCKQLYWHLFLWNKPQQHVCWHR